LWRITDSTSYVTDIQFLPDGSGVALMRELFDYRHANDAGKNGWRFRDVIAAYDWAGNPLWRHEGVWRTMEPFMGQFAFSSDGAQWRPGQNGG
jgi:hypothetical protein